jgi:hypothetical protein
MRAGWRFIGLLHNLPLEAPVETEHMTVVPMGDPRLRANMANEDFKHFVTAFKDQYGRRRRASALLARGAVRRKPEAVLAFRNALAISSIVRAWIAFLGIGRQLEYLKYSGYFDLYPHYLSRDHSTLIVQSPSVLGVDETKEFRGQTSPELAPAILNKDFYDEELFAALMNRWRRRHLKGSHADKEDESLFRSLEMAYRAARIPTENRGSLDDYGANLALWCSAMEILVWPLRKYAAPTDVLKVLRPAVASSERLRRRRYLTRVPGSPRRKRVTLMEKLYCEMHWARNDFLHGNQVTPRAVHPSGHRTRLSLLSYAPVLYKCALYTTLGLWSTAHAINTMEAARHRVSLGFTADALFSSTRRYERDSRRRRSLEQ